MNLHPPSFLYRDVVEYLMNHYGFFMPKIIANFEVDDDYTIIPDELDDPNSISDPIFLKLRERFTVIEPRNAKIKDILNGKAKEI